MTDGLVILVDDSLNAWDRTGAVNQGHAWLAHFVATALREAGVTLPDEWEQVAGYCGFRLHQWGVHREGEQTGADTRILILDGDEAIGAACKYEPVPVFVRREKPE